MSRTKSDLVQIAAAFALPLVLVGVAGLFSWSATWQRAEGELIRTADGAAEFAQRMFSSALLAAKLADSLLDDATDQDIRQNETQYHGRLADVVEDLPGAISITVADAEGEVLLMSNQTPAPPVSVAARDWVRARQDSDAPAMHVGALSLGQVHGQLFFSVSMPRRMAGEIVTEGGYIGLVKVALDPYAVADGLSTTTHEPSDVIALVRSDGEILSTTRGLRPGLPSLPAESRLRAKIEAGETRGIYEGRALGLREAIPVGRGLSIAFRQVGEFPVYVTVSRTPSAIVAPWLRTMAWMLALGLPTSLALGLLSLTAVRRRNALLASQAELAASFDSAATGTALVDAATGRILKVNRRLCEMTCREATDLEGMTLDQLLDRGGSTDPEDAAAGLDRLQRPDGSVRWVECATAPVTRTRSDAPELEIATLHDITERKESQERQALLAREVDHRAKNVLAIVRAVIRLAREPDVAQFADKIDGRIRALARAHELLARDRWQGADLADLIRDELIPYQDGARVTLSGAAVRIAAAAVQPLSIALHELATNAVKHGALGTSDGALSVAWRETADEERLELVWQEEGRAASPDASGSGAGLRILRGSIEQLGGTVDMDWREAGLSCTIRLPMEAVLRGPYAGTDAEEEAPVSGWSGESRSLLGTRVLLVEDEIILAMDIRAMLEELGCIVIGPASTLAAAQALAAKEAGRIDVALLDVNVKGATTFDLARQLRRDGAACIFVTGYSELPETAENCLLLRKPVSERDIAAALRAVTTPAHVRGREPAVAREA